MTHATTSDPRTSGSRRRRRGLVLGLAAVLIVGLAVLAAPLVGIRSSAEDARTQLLTAADALSAGDVRTARAAVEQARQSVDDATDRADGLGGDVWSVMPVAGTAVDDVRHLVDALSDATAVAEIAVDLYPRIAGKNATLFEDEQLDLAALASVTTRVREAGGHLVDADRSLDAISGSTPFLGDVIAGKRDEAAAEVSPMADTYRNVEPMLDDLPAFFGADGERTYLIALLNPAELRYSGGASLAFAPMTWRDGSLELGDAIDLDVNPRLFNEISWRRVRGNPFHGTGPIRMRNATFNPSWSVSGEELLRAWKSATGTSYDGVLAMDVVTLSRLFGVSGGVDVPGYGVLDQDNLVTKLIGSYDAYYPDPAAQDDLSANVIPAFKEQFFGGGDYFAKGRVLTQAAGGRHLALYLRDDDVQDGFAALGMTGDLAAPEGDYLGVFTQNTNGSKVDIYQRRRIEDTITMSDDGSAQHRLDVTIDNATPPYAAPVPDPRFGYFTRWAGMFVSAFLPAEAEVTEASFDGQDWEGRVRGFRDHGFIVQQAVLEPGATAAFTARYAVPDVFEVSEDTLVYSLAMDPQGLVVPEAVDLEVRVPEGWTVTSAPEGWTIDGGVARYATEGLDASQDWEITAERDN